MTLMGFTFVQSTIGCDSTGPFLDAYMSSRNITIKGQI